MPKSPTASEILNFHLGRYDLRSAPAGLNRPASWVPPTAVGRLVRSERVQVGLFDRHAHLSSNETRSGTAAAASYSRGPMVGDIRRPRLGINDTNKVLADAFEIAPEPGSKVEVLVVGPTSSMGRSMCTVGC